GGGPDAVTQCRNDSGTDQASFKSRTARPAARMLSRRISEYLRDSSAPCAPPSNAALTASYTSEGRVFLLVAAVGMSMSIPGQIFIVPALATARAVSLFT